MVAEIDAIPWIGEKLRSLWNGLEREHGLILESALFTRADAPEPSKGAIQLRSMGDERFPGFPRSPESHAGMEERSLHIAREVGKLIRSDSSLITRAKNHIDRLLRTSPGTAARDIAEWRHVLEAYSTERIRRFLVSKTPRAERLRQSSPFLAVLTPEERKAVIESLKDQS